MWQGKPMVSLKEGLFLIGTSIALALTYRVLHQLLELQYSKLCPSLSSIHDPR
jgi:hypothetical protein